MANQDLKTIQYTLQLALDLGKITHEAHARITAAQTADKCETCSADLEEGTGDICGECRAVAESDPDSEGL